MSPHDFVDKRRSAQTQKNVKAASKHAGSGFQREDEQPGTVVSEDDYAALHGFVPDDDADQANDSAGEQVSVSADGERYLRMAADFENLRRRSAQQLLDARRYSSETAARTLLPVLDNLQRGLEHAPEDEQVQAFVEGVRMAVRDFEAKLNELGVRPIESLGMTFDPAVHEAIGSEEGDVEQETVIDELQRGWMLHDKVLRPAIVRIATPASS